MNLIKSLEKQLEVGKNLVDVNGEVFGLDKLQKKALKEYNALVKAKEIDPMQISFKEFFYDSLESHLTVREVIAFIEQPFESESEPNEEAEIHTAFPTAVPPADSAETEN